MYFEKNCEVEGLLTENATAKEFAISSNFATCRAGRVLRYAFDSSFLCGGLQSAASDHLISFAPCGVLSR